MDFLFVFFLIFGSNMLLSSYFDEVIWSLRCLRGLHFMLWFQWDAWQYVTFGTHVLTFAVATKLNYMFQSEPEYVTGTQSQYPMLEISFSCENKIWVNFRYLTQPSWNCAVGARICYEPSASDSVAYSWQSLIKIDDKQWSASVSHLMNMSKTVTPFRANKM